MKISFNMLIGMVELTSRVVVIPLSFKASQNSLTLYYLQLHAFDLIVEEAVERHLAVYFEIDKVIADGIFGVVIQEPVELLMVLLIVILEIELTKRVAWRSFSC